MSRLARRDKYPGVMSVRANFVSLHPYFTAHPGKLGAFKAALPAFRKKTATESGKD